MAGSKIQRNDINVVIRRLKEVYPEKDLYEQAMEGAIAGLSYMLLDKRGKNRDAIEGLFDRFDDHPDLDSVYWEGLKIIFDIFYSDDEYERLKKKLREGDDNGIEEKAISKHENDTSVPRENILSTSIDRNFN